ncbi:hemin ABC transporter substrate-binding protein [Agrobacterium rhizogenes]|uniref:Hemin transport system n=1 Tax=Rhizobium rhizogenes (strain K84 / ATCC BAA-868) TaxID=311403 RepID=B9J864_RHIR8|nr:hemin ABC transporter substrate-binding protein [Rhizobium rhizogenes]ACM27385.1 hemin transport system [Rhizobium rhizogenes K84]KAA6484742.1 hemin ABC transporter substrate-binding protein [Agrobacterium sp. ICMP 7243]MDJ1637170.1 hemin ABC transporter substrate-binding protein [Rhizobium rhizogenes]NTF49357.1 hemin ABC transporter substrate-binding protein [Rhizobium rhizogenes]NTF62359.1 hemin ABC transporter substrate-binding protein [Rhizobium rhizogenes]
MTMLTNIKRIKPWEIALTAVVMILPLVPVSPIKGNYSLVQRAHAAEVPKIDTSRLVSVGGDVTEIIYALGEEKRLIARDSTSNYPEAAAKLPDVGYMRALSPEGILAVNPTAIIAVEGSGPPEALAVLRNASLPFETVPQTYDRDGILKKIDVVGSLLGVPDKAKALEGKVAADLDAAIANSEKRPEAERKRVLFILSNQNGKILASGDNTAANGIIKLAGAINAVGSFSGYKPLTDEAIIEAKPDVILIMDREGPLSMKDEDLLKQPAISLTPAASHKAIVRMDGLHLLGFGPRTASAVRELNAAIYGG